MGSYLGSAVFSASVFFYCLGLIFGVVGYIGDWLDPRSPTDSVERVGVRTVCFQEFKKFPQTGTLYGCHDTSRTSERFVDVPDEQVRPAWYTKVQDMHLASLILIFLTLILVIGFLIAYCVLKRQLKRRRRPSSTLLLSKAALGLWFILAAVAGALLLSAPLIFIKNYEKIDDKNKAFFGTTKDTHGYGNGVALTIAGGVSLLVSFILGLIIFITVVKKMCRLSSGDAKMVFADEFANLGGDDTEMERLSNDDLDTDRVDNDVTHKKAYPVAAPRRGVSTTGEGEEKSYQNIPKTEKDGGQAYQNIPTPRPKSTNAPQPAKRLSTHGAVDKQRAGGEGYKADYSQGRDRSPAAGARSLAGESMASTAYPPSTQYSNYSPYMQSRHPHSDTESSLAGRTRSVVRSTLPADSSSATSSVPPPTVVAPPAGKADVKHSRYAGAF